jgi:hypothetical protein
MIASILFSCVCLELIVEFEGPTTPFLEQASPLLCIYVRLLHEGDNFRYMNLN